MEQGVGHQRAPGRMLAKVASRERQVGAPSDLLPSDLAPQRMKSCTTPTMPCGAAITKITSIRPTSSTPAAEEIDTMMYCCAVPSRSAPISGQAQLLVP